MLCYKFVSGTLKGSRELFCNKQISRKYSSIAKEVIVFTKSKGPPVRKTKAVNHFSFSKYKHYRLLIKVEDDTNPT